MRLLRKMTEASRTALAATVLVLSVGAGLLGGGEDSPSRAKAEGPVAELPRGGTSVLPERQVVAFDGTPGAPALGPIGRGKPQRIANRLKGFVKRFRTAARPVLPAFHLISTIVLASPGPGGKYRNRISRRTIDRYLRVARRNRFLLLLDIQPGRSTFMQEVRALKRYLREPDVGIALDPEWNMGKNGIPGRVIGSVDARSISEVQNYMASFVRRLRLPDKLLVVHQFTRPMIKRRNLLRPVPGVDLAISIDGFGTPGAKRGVYRSLAPRRKGVFSAFKVFFQEDTRLMKPAQIKRLKPPARVVIYE